MIHGPPHEPRVVNATVGPRRPLNRRSFGRTANSDAALT